MSLVPLLTRVFLACGMTDMRKGFDGQGLCLFSKRLDRGRFVWPATATGTVTLTPAQLSMLLEGIDWRRPERTFTPTLAG